MTPQKSSGKKNKNPGGTSDLQKGQRMKTTLHDSTDSTKFKWKQIKPSLYDVHENMCNVYRDVKKCAAICAKFIGIYHTLIT